MSKYVNLPLGVDTLYIVNEHIYTGRDFPFHYHPEIELTCVLRSSGMRVVGDSIEPYTKGDLVAVGPNLPHQWQKNAMFKPQGTDHEHIIVVHLQEQRLREIIDGTRELHALKPLLEEIRLGVQFGWHTANYVATLMRKLVKLDGVKGVIQLLEILEVLHMDTHRRTLASPRFKRPDDTQGRERIFEVVEYLLANFHQEVRAADLAERMNMSPSAFSHYFRKRTSKPFRAYLNEIRLGNACKLLQETDKSIVEICYECGFGTVSNFNRAFKATYRIPPRHYRVRVQYRI